MTREISFPVKITEVDSMGIVHHANYPLWFEAGRRDFLKRSGISLHQMHKSGFYLPLLEMNCLYKKPAKFGDEIHVITKLTYISYVKIKFEYTIMNQTNDKILTTGRTVHAFTDKALKPVNAEKYRPEIYTKLKQQVESKVLNIK
jgi:acyl-CoA thioester hydrolase